MACIQKGPQMFQHYLLILISGLETLFVSSTVLLCTIHVLRYFREKVLTGKAFWGEAGDKNYLCGADMDDIMSNIKLLIDAPSG